MTDNTMREKLLPSHLITGMLELAAQNNIPIEDLLNEVGIDQDVIGNENSHLSNSQVSAIIFSLSSKLDDPAFGLRLGESIYKSIQLIAGPFFSSSESLRAAFDKLMLYQDLIIPLTELDLEEYDDYVDLCVDSSEVNSYHKQLLNEHDQLLAYISSIEILLSGLWVSAQQFLSSDFHIYEAGFKYPAPKHVKEYQNVFDCPIHFEKNKNYLRVEKSLFDKKLFSSLPSIHKKAETQVIQKLKKLKKSESILNIVKDYIKEHVSNEDLSLDNAAKQLHMTGRTLQRALRMENTSFIDIRDSVRSELACHYLEHTRISIEDISEKIGFSDASGFYNAFKRWHGMSPGSYRSKATP